jgi:phage tail sheath protein FI
VEEIAVVAAPGSSAYAAATEIRDALVAHAERAGAYRIAVLDTPPGVTPAEAAAWREGVESTRAALYYPWAAAAVNGGEVRLPPSGFVCGIYARNDAERGVFKAPAGIELRSAARLERALSRGELARLNPAGVNCLRELEGRAVVWGARTASPEPEWKYVAVRRYLTYLEHSIDRGTRWVVFEPNDEPLWARVRGQVEQFLYGEWRAGGLAGQKPNEAFFVRCDRTTMTQNDIDSGRLICLVGVATVRAAEFVLFRIGQWTGRDDD